MKKTIALTLVILSLITMAIGCAPAATPVPTEAPVADAPATDAPQDQPETDAAKKIGVSLYYLKDEWYVGVADEFAKQGAARGYKVQVTDADADYQKQLEHIENLQSQQVDLMCIAPVDDNGIVSTIDGLVEAGIPVLAYGTCPAGGDYFSFVGWDVWQTGYDLGMAAGEYVNAELGGTANVAMLVVPTIENLLQRSEGFKAGLEASGANCTIVAEQNYEGLRDEAMTTMENILQMGNDIDVVFAAQDPGAFGARAALEASGKPAKIYSCGGFGDEIYDAIAGNDPYIVADIIVSPYLFVKGIYDCIDLYFSGEEVDKEYLVPIAVCTNANYKEVYGE